ncbi:MAG: class I SAM-dependent methyltransferase [Aurantibacter sp.]
MGIDIIGKALLDFQAGNYSEDIITYSSLEEKDVIPLHYLFRDYESMPSLEQEALKHCYGEVLDIGCGAGSHSLHLQRNGVDSTALDTSAGAIEVCRKRRLRKVVQANVMNYSDKKFDTLLMLMNGVGIVGNIKGLGIFLRHAANLLKPNGCILLDSSDIIYMFETEEGLHDLSGNKKYYGEVEFSMHYKGEKSDIFEWLYVDFDTLRRAAQESGYNCELLFEGKHYDYLAKLSLELY